MTRLVHSIRHELSRQYRNILIAAGAIAGSMVLFSMLSWLGGVTVLNIWEGYPPVMIIFGLLITTGAFSELRTPGNRIAYLLRPTSVWEKVIGKLVVSTIFVWVVITVTFLLGSLIGVVVYTVVGGPVPFGEALVRSLADGRWIRIAVEVFLGFLPIQAFFFFGSVYFHKHTAGKTLLAIVGWIASYGILTVLSARFIFHRYFVEDIPHSGARRFGHFEGPLSELNIDQYMWREIAPFYLENPEILRIGMSVFVVLLFWGLAVLRLRETEA